MKAERKEGRQEEKELKEVYKGKISILNSCMTSTLVPKPDNGKLKSKTIGKIPNKQKQKYSLKYQLIELNKTT